MTAAGTNQVRKTVRSDPEVSAADERHLDACADALRVVGIGASAGGLSALESFFENCPNDSGAAFVVIQHLSPKHESLMAGLLARRTSMPVTMIDADSQIEPNHVYLIPPGAVMRVDDGILRLSPRSEVLSLPIDIFFTSLAENYGRNSVGIVLSGTGSDGTRGAIAINEAGGLVLIQDPAEAKFDGMPLSVRRAGVVDASLPVSELASRALAHSTKPPSTLVHGRSEDQEPAETEPGTGVKAESDALDLIFEALNDATGVDFRAYKSTTILRRLGRRMQVRSLSSLKAYLELLLSSAEELDALHRELLISVTRFFRDEEAFAALEERVIPRIVDGLARDDMARVWVAGCATGEEAYSIAILLSEAFERVGRPPQVKIFATDVNPGNLQYASAGAYPSSIATEVSPARLERFFVKERDTFTVSPGLRQALVFARHDLLRDPPFTRMDLVSCRNTLIYFRRDSQDVALRRLQYAVRNDGFLFLGPSESLVTAAHGFAAVDAPHKIFVRVAAREHAPLDLTTPSPLSATRRTGHAFETVRSVGGSASSGSSPAKEPTREQGGVVGAAVQALLDTWAPPSIVVNERFEAVHFQGDLRPFLRPRSGKASFDLSRLLPEALGAIASVLVQKARDAAGPQVSDRLELCVDDVRHALRLHAIPLATPQTDACVMLCFERLDCDDDVSGKPQQLDLAAVARARIGILEEQLDATRLDLQATIQELETSNEELQATNEELMASNEELQSSNEELQSVNEEINTVNAEYQEKMALLNRLNADLSSMIRAVGLATIFLDDALLITRFSPDASAVFKLRESDIGRPLGDITHKLNYPNLLDDIRQTIGSEERLEREVTTNDGEFFRVRVVPYPVRASGHRGAVLTLMNVTVYRDLARLQGLIDALPEHVALLDLDGTIILTNSAWSRFARANGDPRLSRCGPGQNYLAACRIGPAPEMSPEEARLAVRAHDGVKAVLEGTSPHFSMEYPCHSPEQHRWFFMTAAPVAGAEFGAVVSHIEITSWYDEQRKS